MHTHVYIWVAFWSRNAYIFTTAFSAKFPIPPPPTSPPRLPHTRSALASCATTIHYDILRHIMLTVSYTIVYYS